MREPTDSELLAMIAAGDIARLAEIYSRHQRRVKAALRCWAPSLGEADVEDIAQDVFVSLGRTAARYEDQESFKGWLYRIVQHKLADWRRRGLVRRRFVEASYTSAPRAATDHGASPEGIVDTREMVSRAFSSLPEEQRQVLWLHFVEGLDGFEIAKALGVRRATVYTRINRARATLLETCKEAP